MDHPATVVPDRWLLQGMLGGDPGAGGELRRRHAKSLYALAYGVLWDADVADAVVTQVFDQAAHRGREFETGADTVFAWLARITRLQAERAAGAMPAPPPARACLGGAGVPLSA